MSDNESSSSAEAVAPLKKRSPSVKQKAMIAQREQVRAELSKALGKGARVANAAAYLSRPAEQRNMAAYVNFIKKRDAAAAEAKAAAKGAEKKVVQVKKEAKNLAKTARKNAAAAAQAAQAANKAKGKTKKVQYFKFKYDSVEREAKKLAKQAEELQAKLSTVDVQLKDVCKLCKEFQESTPNRT